jgi:hypothetical protein
MSTRRDGVGSSAQPNHKHQIIFVIELQLKQMAQNMNLVIQQNQVMMLMQFNMGNVEPSIHPIKANKDQALAVGGSWMHCLTELQDKPTR